MNKVIFRTALITLAGVALATLLVFSLWILCSPQTMATTCEKTGNYSFAVTCADLRYQYTKDVNDLSRCAQDGIMSGKDKHILKYGEMLVASEKFDELCARKDEELSLNKYGKYRLSYKNYVLGHLAAAQYRSGNTEKAVETASSGGEKSFIMLVLEIAERGDGEAARSVLTTLGAYEQSDDVTSLKAILEKYA